MVKHQRRIIVIEDKKREPVQPGYALSGASVWERQAAHTGHADMRPTVSSDWSRLDVLIHHERKQVAKLEKRTVAARGTDKHAPLCVKLQRLRAFLRRLEAEQRGRAP